MRAFAFAVVRLEPQARRLTRAELLEELARRVDRLAPSRTDPEAFHADKSEIAEILRLLAGDVAELEARPPTTVWRRQG